MLKALIIHGNDKLNMADLVQISRAEAMKREHGNQNVSIRTIFFVPELGVWCSIYEIDVLGATIKS